MVRGKTIILKIAFLFYEFEIFGLFVGVGFTLPILP